MAITVKHRGFFGTLAGLLRRYNATNSHIIAGREYFPLVFQAGSDFATATNMPAALAFLFASAYLTQKVDLSEFSQVRLTFRAGGNTLSGGKLYCKYVTTFSTTAADWLTLGETEVQGTIPLTVNNVDTGWINLVAGAKVDNVFLAIFTSDGDGAKDPLIGSINVEFRTVAGSGSAAAGGGGGGGVTDHGELTGLGDDDHTQYHNDARGDVRYIRGEVSLTEPPDPPLYYIWIRPT